MASKLKILVDYPCDVFCDYDLIGYATPKKMFFIELRKGKYILEFKVKESKRNIYTFSKSVDYEMHSNDEDDLIRVDLTNQITINMKPESYFNSIHRELNGFGFHLNLYSIYVKFYEDVEHEINSEGTNFNILKNKKRISFDCIVKYKDLFSNFNYVEIINIINIETENIFNTQSISFDIYWINDRIVVVYTNTSIIIYKLFQNSQNHNSTQFGWESKSIYDNVGDIHALDIKGSLALIVKNNKCGIFDLDKNEITCQPIYNEILSDFEERKFYRSDTYIAKIKDLYGVIDINGNIIVPYAYDKIYNSFLGYVVEKDNKWGIYSKNGVQYWYDNIFILEHNDYGVLKQYHSEGEKIHMLCFQIGKQIGFWNCTCKKTSIMYDEICMQSIHDSFDRLITVKRDNKIGLIDIYGMILVECEYDDIELPHDNESKNNILFYCDYIYYLKTNNKAYYYKNWEEECFKNKILFEGYSLEDVKRLIKIPNVLVRKGDKYGIVQLNNEVLIPIEYSETIARSHIENLEK